MPEKDASVKCLDAVLGKVHLPCWGFIVERDGLGCCILAFDLSCLLSFYVVTTCGKVFLVSRDSRWFRQARKLQLTACGRMVKSARRCPPWPSRRFAKRTMEQWALHSQGTIAFCPHRLQKTVLSSSFFLLVLLSSPRDCLLDVSLFFASHCASAPVCFCHRSVSATGTL